MGSSNNSSSVSSFLKSVGDILTTPVPLPAVLEMEIPLPEILTRPIKLPSFFGVTTVTSRLARKRKTVSSKRNPRKFQPSNTAQKQDFLLEGEIRPGQRTKYSVNGEDFEIGPQTWIFGNLKLGTIVKIRGKNQPGGARLASSISTIE